MEVRELVTFETVVQILFIVILVFIILCIIEYIGSKIIKFYYHVRGGGKDK